MIWIEMEREHTCEFPGVVTTIPGPKNISLLKTTTEVCLGDASENSFYFTHGQSLPYAVNLPSHNLHGHRSDHAVAKIIHV